VSAQQSDPPSPGWGKILPPSIRPLLLSRAGEICPQNVLDYVGSSRAHGEACLPGQVVVSLSIIRDQNGLVQAGCSPRFQVHELCWAGS
jgi:hypothetical protein